MFILKTSCIAFLLLYANNLFAQTQVIHWDNAIGGSGSDQASDISQTFDNGFIISGSSNFISGDVISNNGLMDAFIVKTDSTGSIEWTKAYGGSMDDFAMSSIQTDDGGYLVVGYTLSNDSDVTQNYGQEDIWLLKLDAQGILLWEKTFGGSGSEIAYDIIPVSDGSYMIIGSSTSTDNHVTFNHGNMDSWVVKLDTAGSIIWQKTFGGTGNEIPYSIYQTTDSGYVIGGETSSNNGDVSGNHGADDMWLFKIDSVGNLQWQSCFGGSGYERADEIALTHDNGCIIAGISNYASGQVSANYGVQDFWVVKVDAAGNMQWQNNFGGSNVDYTATVIQKPDLSYIICGFTASIDHDVSTPLGALDMWLINVDTSGNLIWEKTLGGTNQEWAVSVINSGNGVVICGTTRSNDLDVTSHNGGNDFWLVNLQPPIITSLYKDQLENVKVFPNPTSQYITFQFSINTDIYNLTVTDLLGRMSIQQIISANNKTFDISTLAPGVYVAELIQENKICWIKFVKH